MSSSTSLNSVRADTRLVRAADVSDPGAVQAMMKSVGEEWGGIDILVNNAGILRDRSIAKMTLEEWRTVLDVNLSGVFHCCKFGLEILQRRRIDRLRRQPVGQDGVSRSVELRRRQGGRAGPGARALARVR